VHQLLHDLAVDVLQNLAETAKLKELKKQLNVSWASTNTPRSRMTNDSLMMSLPTDKLIDTVEMLNMQGLHKGKICCERLYYNSTVACQLGPDR